MSTTTHSIGSDAQDINWQSVFNHAHEHSLEFEAGDILPHGRISASLQAVTSHEVDNSIASQLIQRAIRNEKLCKREQGYKIVRDGPGTGDIRQFLDMKLREVMQNGENAVIQSPTSSGKTYTPSTERWRDLPEITGDQPVILLSGTTDAREDALAKSKESWVTAKALYGRNDACPVARGEYDSTNQAGNDAISAPDGTEPSDWFKRMCDDRGLTLSIAHGEFKRSQDEDLPCCSDGGCPSMKQWEDIPRDCEGEVNYDVLHATHPFARVPQLIKDCNLIIDERPDFSTDLPRGKMREAVTSYLTEIDADVATWEELIIRLQNESLPNGFVDRLSEPDVEWFRTNPKAHALAPGIARAIVKAKKRAHDRWMGETRYCYPELIPGRDGPTQEMIIRIVLNDANEVRLLHAIPDFSKARSVIGLDAHPTMPKWKGNTVHSIGLEQVVEEADRHKWRRNQRKLHIVQVGDNKNTWTKHGFKNDKVGVLAEELRWKYGDKFRTGITAKRFHDDLRELLATSGVADPETLYYGNEKSVENFDSESVGLVAGCISPSSDHIKDWLALLDQDAVPKREVRDGYQSQEWVGSDRAVAHELLADVREDSVKQACGRYARSPQDSDSGATVYVLTNVLPAAYVDETIPDVQVFDPKQKGILDYAYGRQQVRRREIAEEVEASERHVHDTLDKCREYPWVEVEEVGPYGAFEYTVSRSPNGMVEL